MPKKHTCACCGQQTIVGLDCFEICPVCNWEDDAVQRDDPEFQGGANQMSLNEARAAFAKGLPVY